MSGAATRLIVASDDSVGGLVVKLGGSTGASAELTLDIGTEDGASWSLPSLLSPSS